MTKDDTMKTYKIAYYKTPRFVNVKTVRAKTVDSAIKKARVKYIMDIQEV